MQFDNDQLGAGSFFQIGAAYAQRVYFAEDNFLSIGIMAKFSQMMINGFKVKERQEGFYTNSILDYRIWLFRIQQ